MEHEGDPLLFVALQGMHLTTVLPPVLDTGQNAPNLHDSFGRRFPKVVCCGVHWDNRYLLVLPGSWNVLEFLGRRSYLKGKQTLAVSPQRISLSLHPASDIKSYNFPS